MISIIVATSESGVIGHGNSIPWYVPRDLKHFKELTTGNTCLMGRKTYESIVKRLGHPLPNRKNVILTNQKDFQAPDCTVVHSWAEALAATKAENVFVSGGAEVYKLALPYTDRIYHTVIHTTCEGDAFFEFNQAEWNEVKKEFHPSDEKNQFDCTFFEYEKKR
jgi:dihydrofolate reductase